MERTVDGQLAQLIALVGHGSSFLAGSANNDALRLDQSHSTFQFIGALSFARYQNAQAAAGTQVAADAKGWFETLRAAEAQRLWYVAFAWNREDLPEYIAVSFAGGVPRAIQVDYADGSYELWYPRWTVGDKDRPDRRIWRVEYRALSAPQSEAMTPSVEVARTRLWEVLRSAEKFARRVAQGAEPWAELFAAAQSLLTAENSLPSYHADMLPPDGYSPKARQLLAAATQANVFGGMGSWNDLGFSDSARQAEYEQVTRALYEAVKLSFVAAVNSFDAARVTRDK